MLHVWESLPGMMNMLAGVAAEGGPGAALAVLTSTLAGAAMKAAALSWAAWRAARAGWWGLTWCAARAWAGCVWCVAKAPPPPAPVPPEPEPFGEDVLAILEEIETGPAARVQVDGGVTRLVTGPLSVTVGGKDYCVRVDGRDIAGDIRPDEAEAIEEAAACRVESLEAAALAKRRAEAAAKVRGAKPAPAAAEGKPCAVAWSHSGPCAPGCDCVHSPGRKPDPKGPAKKGGGV